MRKFTWTLVGVLIGQLIMCPAIYKLYTTPLIVYEMTDVRDKDYTTTKPITFVVKDVPSVFHKKKRDLYMHVRTQMGVVNEYKKRHGEVKYGLLGFYEPLKDNPDKHEIFTVNSVSVVIHEMRHIFEAYFHRSLENIECISPEETNR